MAIVLTAVTVIAGALLGYVNKLTQEPISEANAKALNEAIQLVVPGFDNQPTAKPDTIELNGTAYMIYKATKGGEFIGAAVQSTANGFGGPLTLLVGFDAEGNIIDYSLLSHAETPGLGSKADIWFKKDGKGAIVGMNPGKATLSVSKDGGNVDAITASTITSRAFLSAINNAYQAYANGNNADVTSGATKKAPQEEVPAENNSNNQVN